MKIIKPIPMTDTILVSCNVPENDYPVWAPGTTYAEGTKVMYPSTHTIYEALKSTSGQNPATSPLAWLPLGPTNRWSMFDEKVGTATTNATDITFSIKPGISTGLAFMEMRGVSSIEVQMVVNGTTVYNKTFNMIRTDIVYNAWTYYFGDVTLKRVAVITNLPTYRTGQINIKLVASQGTGIRIGSFVCGTIYPFGESVKYGATVGIQDYSRKDRDDFGNTVVVERAYAKRARLSFDMPNNSIDYLQEILAEIRAKPAVYIGDEVYSSLVVYGFYKDFDIVIPYHSHSECSLELEGLV